MSAIPLVPQLRRWTSHALFPSAAITGLSAVILLGAYAFEYLGGLKPCPLCLEQRVPWAILIVLGATIAAGHVWRAPWQVLLALCAAAGVVAIWGAYLGGYHAGVEYKWWEGPQTCSGANLPLPGDISGPLSTSQIVRCDEIPWALLGISLAGFNFIFSLVVAAIAVAGGRQVWKEQR
jgi:disulfide bond formation protein DsbB